MLIAPGAVLPILHALGVLPPILVLEEVAAPALGAFENDLVAGHVCSLSLAAISYQSSAISHQPSVISYRFDRANRRLGPHRHQLIADSFTQLATGIEPVTSSLPRMRSTD